jgi:ubiquinone/menaquinone biosynthesis C-methylase UbiE
MPKKQTYTDLAKYYDLIYSFKDYKSEANKIKQLIKKYKKSLGNDLLEMACGTGKHLAYLKGEFSILATDANKAMLSIAKKNAPDVSFRQANMIEFDLGRTFDVVICLFSSIGYVKSYANLNKTIKNFANHLKKGGVVMIEPWFTQDVYLTGLPTMTTYDGKDIKIARLSVGKKRGILSILDMHYLIAKRNKQVEHFVERHELAMFEKHKILAIMEQHGLKAVFSKSGLMKDRGIYIGVKQ